MNADSNEEFSLSDVVGLAYEYRDPNTLGISSIVLSESSQIEVFGLDGQKVSSTSQSLQEILNRLPKGVYIIKENGKTLKITK